MIFEYGKYGIENPALIAFVVPVALLFYLYLRKPRMNSRRYTFLYTRSLYALLLLVALAGPYMLSMSEEFHDVSSVTILADKSESVSFFENDTESIAGDLYVSLKERLFNSTGSDSISLKEFSEGNRTAIGDAIYQNSIDSTKENNILVLVSDGNNNYGRDPLDVARAVSSTNTRIFAVAPMSPKDELFILDINGEKKIPANSRYAFRVDVGKLGGQAKYSIKVAVDGKVVHTSTLTQTQDTESISLNQTFKENGVHTISVTMVPETPDYFEANNRLIKTIDVVDKPSVFLWSTQQSPLYEILKQNYDVRMGNLGTDLSAYSAVILDNLNASQLSDANLKTLNQYVIDGGGLVVVGGDKAFEKGGYTNKPQLEAMLPVVSVKEPEKKRKEMAVVLIIDISQSTAYGMQYDSKIEVEKGLALNIIKQLDPKDYVGVVAFNVEAFTIADIKRLSQNKGEIENNVPRLVFGGGTDLLPALDRAEGMLENLPYDKTIILISDGVLGAHAGSRSVITKEKVASMQAKGITTYTVGVGFDTNEYFMQELASEGKGKYFKPEDWQRLAIEFEEKDVDKDKEKYQLDVYNKYHYITQNVNLPSTSLVNYNDVTAKSIAQVLITAEGKKPIVTVWRFGLGRVVALTTDNGVLWSQALYNAQGGRIASSITNWAIGDLEKKKDTRIEVSDTNVDVGSEVLIKSSQRPVLYKWSESDSQVEVDLKQVDVGMYSARMTFPGTGFYPLRAVSQAGEDIDGIAVNYPVEYSRMGVNEQVLEEIAGLTGGELYPVSMRYQLEEDVLEYIKEGSLKTTETRMPLDRYFIAAALGLFFLDVVVRRIREIQRLKKAS